jgi:hypothetical protein
MADTATSGGFTAASIRAYTARKKEEASAKRVAHEAAVKADRDILHEAFLKREVSPEALSRVESVVRKAVEAGEKEVMVFQFPSDWLPDQGRAITNQDKDWTRKLDGFAKRAFEYYERELAPRGFQLRAGIVNWPGGMPGDVGFFLRWHE